MHLCNIDRDGTKKGMDIDYIKKACSVTNIPIICSGGCGTLEHFVEGYKYGNVSAVSASTYFCFKDQGFMQVRSALKNAGISIRTKT